MYRQFGISDGILDLAQKVEKDLEERFSKFDKTAEYNQCKIIKTMQDNRVSDIHFGATSGYGYNDLGRDTLEKVYADIFHTEDALVRPQITCGTHALNLALSSNLRPGDELLSITGKHYDTLEKVIGISPCPGSLMEYGITYRQVELKEQSCFDFEAIEKVIGKSTKIVAIQRSKGYQTRKTLSSEEIEKLLNLLRKSIKISW
jgi:cystathionine beta-lyase family protein involved in aluminum resistance